MLFMLSYFCPSPLKSIHQCTESEQSPSFINGSLMNEITDTLLIIVLAVTAMTVSYKLAPFRQWQKIKPRFVIFPKYTTRYTICDEQIINNIVQQGFKRQANHESIYTRGKIYGDFSAKAMKLQISINQSEKKVSVHAPFFGIFFDTGDVWQVTSRILGHTT